MWCWGRGNEGQLGNGQFSRSPTPVLLSGLPGDVLEIWASDLQKNKVSKEILLEEYQTSEKSICFWMSQRLSHILAGCLLILLPSRGCLQGSNKFSEIFLGGNAVTDLVEIAYGGGYHTCSRTVSQMWCWGSNSNKQLGRTQLSNLAIPTGVTGLPGANTDCHEGDNWIWTT